MRGQVLVTMISPCIFSSRPSLAVFMLVAVWLLLTRTRIGLVIQAALTHPQAVETLGHDVPRVFMLVFGSGCALAGLAGVIGGITFITEPAMAVSKLIGTTPPAFGERGPVTTIMPLAPRCG